MSEENNLQNLTSKERYDLKKAETELVSKQHRRRLTRRVLFWTFALLIIVGAVLGMVKLSGTPPSNQTALLTDAVSSSDWSRGNQEAKVIFVEYSDFQCPACSAYYPLLKKLNEDFGGKIKFIYRHFPLRQIHKNAELAAHAAEAAGRQGKFWQMHDMLFENQNNWSGKSGSDAEDTFASYARSLNLDVERFNKDLDLKDIKEKVENDYQSGVRSQVNATPTFFLNGAKFENPRSYEELRSRIEQEVGVN